MSRSIILILLICSFKVHSQVHSGDRLVIEKIYQNALTSYESYEWLRMLCDSAPGRVVGSGESMTALSLMEKELTKYNPDNLWFQKYNTSAWFNNVPAVAELVTDIERIPLKVVTLGNSVSTNSTGITGEVIMVNQFSDLDSLGEKNVKGKIVFFNHPMENAFYSTFTAYSGAINQRVFGAAEAAKFGAIAAIVRSLAIAPDDYPHTGVSRYEEGVPEIPFLAVSTNDADKLSELVRNNQETTIWLKTINKTIDKVETANLIAEIKGSEFPDKVILAGAHIDAWHNTVGAHDNGTGCVQVMDIIRIYRTLGIQPKHTVRIVLFMDEELNQSGGKTYAEYIKQTQETHLMAIETDAGGFLPLGFSVEANDHFIEELKVLTDELRKYGIYETFSGFSGVDIRPLKEFDTPLAGLVTNNQRYFEYHHSANDTFDKVSRREMQLGTAALASLIYLLDQYPIGSSE